MAYVLQKKICLRLCGHEDTSFHAHSVSYDTSDRGGRERSSSCTMSGEEHECVNDHDEENIPCSKPCLMICLSVVTAALHRKLVPWCVRLVQFFVKTVVSKTTITLFTVRSVSILCRARGVEVRLPDGVIVRIGMLSFFPPETLPLLLVAVLLIPQSTRLGLGLRLPLVVVLLVLLLSPFLLRQLWCWKGKGKAFTISLQDVRVSLPGRASVAKTVSESGASGQCEKAITLPGIVLLYVYLVAIEVRDLRVEIATAKEAASKCRNSVDNDGPLDETTPADAAAGAPPSSAGVRTIELAGLRLIGRVSKRSSRLTVSAFEGMLYINSR